MDVNYKLSVILLYYIVVDITRMVSDYIILKNACIIYTLRMELYAIAIVISRILILLHFSMPFNTDSWSNNIIKGMQI